MDTSDTPRLLKLCSMAVFSFSVISTFKDSPPYLVSPPPSCGRERHILALAGFEPARCPTVSGPLCPLSYSAIYRPQRRYAPGWVRLSGGLFVVLTKALRPRLHRRCFVLPGRLLLFTACFSASRVRPSGPDVWAGFQPAAYAPGKEWVPQAGRKEERR